MAVKPNRCSLGVALFILVGLFVGTSVSAVSAPSGSSSSGSASSLGPAPEFNPLACNLYDGYPAACKSISNCSYCCTSQQCLGTNDAEKQCAEPGAVITAASEARNCDELCWARVAGVYENATPKQRCASCLQRSWCLFCPADANCYSERGFECATSMVSDCNLSWNGDSDDDDSVTQAILPYLIWVCVGLGGLCIVVPLARYCIMKVHSHLEQRRDAERRRQFREQLAARESGTSVQREGNESTDERQPLLGNTDDARPVPAPPAETQTDSAHATPTVVSKQVSIQSLADEDACQLCLEKRADIVYLPCYHSYCCEDCSSKLRPSHRRSEGNAVSCPFCRQRIRAMVSIAPMPQVIAVRFRRPRDSGEGA